MADVIDTSEFRNGLKILIDNEPFVIVEFQHVKPGKGSAFVRTRYKSLITGRTLEKNFKSGEKVGRPDIEEKKMQYLQGRRPLRLHGFEELRAEPHRPGGPGRLEELPQGEHGRFRPLLERTGHLSRPAQRRRAEGRQVRSRRARRYRVGRDETGHAGDRL